MKFTIPKTLQSEHAALHERLRQATEAGGEVGEAAKTLAHLMHPRFVKEGEFALPPLDLLVEHAQTEETVMYPAAILVGQVVRQRLGIGAAALA